KVGHALIKGSKLNPTGSANPFVTLRHEILGSGRRYGGGPRTPRRNSPRYRSHTTT
ncbi:hypothetical protein ACLOJK_024249, partial [Asimina triloba]